MKKCPLIIVVLLFMLLGFKQANAKTALSLGRKMPAATQSQILRQSGLATAPIEGSKADSIKKVIALFKKRDIDKIAEKIAFPLHREYPIPDIKNKDEFKQRFTEVFDEVLIDKIVNSTMEQWSEMGWRGIMLDNGILWMGNSDGVIPAVNYQSDFEKKLRQDLIEKDKQSVHASLQSFKEPIYKIKTKNYLIRIDELNNSGYRYASWKIGKKESSKPDIVLENGVWEFQGSAENHVIVFTNGDYVYKVYRNIVGEANTPDFTLEVEKDGRTMLRESGTFFVE